MKLASSLVLLSVVLLSVLLFCSAAAAQSPESPRIAALQNALQQRSPNAVEAFWHDVQVAGAPLVERVNERRGYSLVTFLWRGDAQQVFVAGHLGQLTGTRRSDNALARLGDTTVWFRSYWLPSDARTVYQIAVNVPLTGPEGVGSGEGFQTDPLNPKKWQPAVPPGDPSPSLPDLSVLELPDAPAQRWLIKRPEVGAGQLQERTWNSTVLGNTRRVWVYTPPGYDPSCNVIHWSL